MARFVLASVVALWLAGCGGKRPPAAEPPPGSSMEHCGWYARAVDDYSRCEAAPQEDRDAARDELAAAQAGLADYDAMSEDERAAKDQACWKAYGEVIERMKVSSCELPPGASGAD